MEWSPKRQMLHVFFQDREPGEFPLRVSAETTNHCNLRCPYCPREQSQRGFGYMTPALFERLAQQCTGKRAAFAPQGFGEPFLDPDFVPRLRRMAELGMQYVDVVTNATLMDEAACRALIEAKVWLVTIDLDGADKQVFEQHRKNAVYDQVVANVRRLFALRDELGSELPHIAPSAGSARNRRRWERRWSSGSSVVAEPTNHPRTTPWAHSYRVSALSSRPSCPVSTAWCSAAR